MKQAQEAKPLYTRRAALYARVSTDEQVRHGFSLGEQRVDLEKYATDKGYTVCGVYVDEGTSARTKLSRRHELQRLLRDVDEGRIDTIILKSLDRWTRCVKDFYALQERLDAHEVTLEFTQERDYCTTTTSGRLMLNLRLTIAQHESDQTGDRIKYVFAGKRRDKVYCGGALPVGYKLEGKHIEIDEQAAEAVRFCFQHVSQGNSILSLLTVVNSRFGLSFTRDKVYYLLRNATYFGKHYNIDNYFPPIISRETFDTAQEILSRHPRRAANDVYLFSGLIVCPCCGRKLIGHRKTKTQSCYYCKNRQRFQETDGRRRCEYSSALGERRLEKWLLAHVADLIKDSTAEVSIKPSRKKKENPLQAIRAKMERLTETYVEGAYSTTEYHKRLDALKEKERQIIAAEMQDTEQKKRREMPAVLRGDNFPTAYEGWTREEKRAFWQGLIKSIEFPVDYNPKVRLKGSAVIDFRLSFF